MDFDSFFSELVKLGTVSEEEAAHALKRYENLRENRPDPGQVARYGALGAAVAPAMSAAENLIKGEKRLIKPAEGKGTGRALLGRAAVGAVGMGLVPIARHWMDRGAEKHKLKEYLHQQGYTQGGHVISPEQLTGGA